MRFCCASALPAKAIPANTKTSTRRNILTSSAWALRANMLASALGKHSEGHMAKKKAGKPQGRKAGKQKGRKAARAAKKSVSDALLAPVKGATRRNIGHVQLEVGRAGASR